MANTKSRRRKKAVAKPRALPFSKVNYLLFAIGIVIIVAGYIALSQGPAASFSSLSVAPVLLVIGYCVVIPISILYRERKVDAEENVNPAGD